MENNENNNDQYRVDDQSSESENEMEDIINDEVVRAIESNVDDGYWSIFPCRIRLPGKKDAVVTMDKNITVSQINARLRCSFRLQGLLPRRVARWRDYANLSREHHEGAGRVWHGLRDRCRGRALGRRVELNGSSQ